MACLDRTPRRVPAGVVIHANGNMMAGPFLLVRDNRAGHSVLFGAECQQPRIFSAPHLAYHSLIRSFGRWRRSCERRLAVHIAPLVAVA